MDGKVECAVGVVFQAAVTTT